MNKIVLLAIAVFIIGFLLGFSLSFIPDSSQPSLTGQVISEKIYTYTTAICNDNNECIDVLVECENGNVKSLTPTSELVALGENFQDFRDKKEKFCE